MHVLTSTQLSIQNYATFIIITYAETQYVIT